LNEWAFFFDSLTSGGGDPIRSIIINNQSRVDAFVRRGCSTGSTQDDDEDEFLRGVLNNFRPPRNQNTLNCDTSSELFDTAASTSDNSNFRSTWRINNEEFKTQDDFLQAHRRYLQNPSQGLTSDGTFFRKNFERCVNHNPNPTFKAASNRVQSSLSEFFDSVAAYFPSSNSGATLRAAFRGIDGF
jgi:hypothetical protein